MTGVPHLARFISGDAHFASVESTHCWRYLITRSLGLSTGHLNPCLNSTRGTSGGRSGPPRCIRSSGRDRVPNRISVLRSSNNKERQKSEGSFLTRLADTNPSLGNESEVMRHARKRHVSENRHFRCLVALSLIHSFDAVGAI